MSFSDNYRKNVSVEAAASALLYTEERQGRIDLLTMFETAVRNIQVDVNQLSPFRPDLFTPDCTVDYALLWLMDEARTMVQHENLLPDEAFSAAVLAHQQPRYSTAGAAEHRVNMVRDAHMIALGALASWERG